MKSANKVVGLLGMAVMSILSYAVTEREVQQMTDAMPAAPVVKPAQERTMLVFSLCNGFKHSSIPYWAKALDIMSEKTGAFKVVHSIDMSVFNPDTLKQYDAICFNNTTKLTPDATQQKAILDFVRGGKGIVGIHAATDNFYDWPQGMEMMGGVFSGHPWTGDGTWAIKIDEPDHPLMASFKGQGFKIKDEIYRTAAPLYSRSKQRVLMSLDMSDPTTKNAKGVTPQDADTGITWIKPVQKGRLFYCSLGHDHAVTWNTAVLAHYLAGIQYAMGDLKVNDTPVDPAMKSNELTSLIEQVKQYDWDKSRTPLTQFSAFIRSQKSPESRKTIEAKLLEMLTTDASLAAKDYVCRELSLMGSDDSLPVLAKMLEAAQTSDMARYALERIPSASVDDLLLTKLQTVQGELIKIGIINTLGTRRTDAAAAPLAALAGGQSIPVAEASISALGAIGSAQSAAALHKLTVGESLKERLSDALLRCADSLSKRGQTGDAQAIYRKLYEPSYPVAIRVGALNGLVKTKTDDVSAILSAAIEGDNLNLQAAAIQNMAEINDAQLLEAVAAKLPTLSDDARIQVCAALAANPQKIGRKEVESLVSGPPKEVRMAAYKALVVLGDGSTVIPLAKAAAGAEDRDEIQQARTALYDLSDPDVNTVLVETIASASSDADEKVMVELIRAVGQRGLSAAVPVLFKTSRHTNAAVASESIRALQSVAMPRDMDGLVDLLIEKPGAATEIALVVTGERIDDRNQRGRAILARYDSVADEAAKASLLRVLGKLGDSNAIPLLEKEKDASSDTLRQAALRAMADWPGSDFMDEMETLAREGKDERSRILAFGAYVRMVMDASDKNSNTGVDALVEAFRMAPRPDEQRLVIGAIGGFATDKALDFVTAAMDNPELKAEAQASAVRICETGGVRKFAQGKEVLDRIIAETSNENMKKRAQKLLN